MRSCLAFLEYRCPSITDSNVDNTNFYAHRFAPRFAPRSGSKSIIEYKNRVSPRPDSNEAKNNLELGIFPKASRKFMLVDYNKSQASHPLPSPSEISQYDIVVTSVERLSLEWKRGKEVRTFKKDVLSVCVVVDFNKY